MKDTDKNKYPVKNIVLFTLNASYLHTSLALRCLADAIIEYKKLDCRAVYTCLLYTSSLTISALAVFPSPLTSPARRSETTSGHFSLDSNTKQLLSI